MSEAVLHLHHLSTSSSYRDTTTGQVTADRNRHSNTPFVFLITDGAVPDEKEVCKWAEANHSNVRVSTFGIGTYCNWFFLRMLAEKCRGFFDAVVYSGNIGRKIDRLMGKASAPVMLNISLDLPGVEYVELYPNPIPDLFMGAPLLISGRYVCQGTFPAQLKLLGTTLQGPTEVVVNCKIQPSLPVNKVFLKAQIDTLTAHAWLTDSEEIKNQIKALSIAESMPSYYTQMVAYQTTPQQQAAMDEQLAKEEEKRSGKKRDESKTKSGTVSGVNPALVAGACVGGVVVIGAAVMFAGDIAGTLGNLPMVDMIGLGGDVIDMLGVGGGCCSCVLEAAGVCCDCDLCMTVCEHGVDCLEGASGWICGALNGGICDVAGEIFGCCGQVVQHIAKIL